VPDDGGDREAPIDGCCALARACVRTAAASGARAAVFAPGCDQMRRTIEAAAERSSVPLFLFNLPATRGTPAALRLYCAELERLARFLVRLGGRPPAPDDWAAAGRACGARRREDIRARPADRVRPTALRVGLLGCNLSRADRALAARLAAAGLDVALDATEFGERGQPGPVSPRDLRRNPLEALARAYAETIPSVCHRPDDRLLAWLRARRARLGLRAFVLLRHTWCDPWHAAAARLRAALDVPLLDIDVGEPASPAAWTTRVEALAEALRNAPGSAP
jgi:benzoyl-CoA reductase/2-hydroxyglutaryl-CoA dehydratase subunit BcrC/BadD/HgdB